MELYITLNGKIVCLTQNATLAPKKGDVIEIKGHYFNIKNVIWHMDDRTSV